MEQIIDDKGVVKALQKLLKSAKAAVDSHGSREEFVHDLQMFIAGNPISAIYNDTSVRACFCDSIRLYDAAKTTMLKNAELFRTEYGVNNLSDSDICKFL